MKRVLVALAFVPCLLWGMSVAPDLFAGNPGFWQWRRALVLLSGALALWWMSSAILLAMRPAWLERAIGGLDRLYRLHRNIGIGAGVLVFTHWMAEWLPKKLAKLGLFPGRPRGPKGDPGWWIDLAKEVGEWTGYIVLALVVLSLLRRLPYRAFRLAHKAFAVLFIAGAFHGLVLMPNDWWSSSFGLATALLASTGLVAAFWSLSGRIGESRRYAARIESLQASKSGVLEVVLRPSASWPGHRAGQFLLADFGHRLEGAHPFTIASAGAAGEAPLRLAIKDLGDYTRSLRHRLKVGDRVIIEGPYGGFDLDAVATGQPQVWVAGGIGITPFLARLRAMTNRGERAEQVDLFYSVRSLREDAFADEIDALCQRSGVRLHRWASDERGALQPETIGAALGKGGSVWFCGPAGWGESLAQWLRAAGLPRARFHRELFEFR